MLTAVFLAGILGLSAVRHVAWLECKSAPEHVPILLHRGMARAVREITSRAEAAIQILAQQFNVSIHDWSLYTFWLIINWYKCYNIGTIIEKLISVLTHNNIVLSLDCLQSVFSVKIHWAGAKAFPPSHLTSFVYEILSVIYLKLGFRTVAKKSEI